MARAILMVMDSFGVGNAPDAARFGDAGADTLGHIAAACAAGEGDRQGLRDGPLRLPHLERLGLACAAAGATGHVPAGMTCPAAPRALWGHGVEVSNGKDTPSGHWEIAGAPVTFDWGYFPRTVPAFPQALTDALIARAGLGGILGNKHASGTEIIADLGLDHIRTLWPICYTSADSVLQIAAHERHFGLDRLYELCALARMLVDPLNIGRVIARPFIGESVATFERTGNRRDYSVAPPPTLLNRIEDAGGRVIAVGKIGDIFAHSGVAKVIKANGNEALTDATLQAIDDAVAGDLVFTNFIDFDMLYGHRRDIAGYAAALEAFDRRLPEIEAALKPGDLAIITADHGCDPSWPGNDHTREQVPILGFGPGIAPRAIGRRTTLSDIAQTISCHLGLVNGPHGTSFL